MMRIMLSGGGTAGSVTALLGIVDEIRQRHEAEFLFLGTVGGPERQLVEAAGLEWRSIPAAKLRRYWSWKNVGDLPQLWQAYRQVQKIIDDWHPTIAVSAGSYVSVPVIWAAHRRGLPTLIHQQDILPGLANRLMSAAASVITVAFPPAAKRFPARKTFITGNPVRQATAQGQAEQGQKLLNLPANRPVVLVIGGGTGTGYFNRSIPEFAPLILLHADVVHITGEREAPNFQASGYHRFTFLTKELPDVLAAATVVVTRAGLGTLTDCAALQKACLVVPMPDTHQERNAIWFAKQQAVQVLPQRSTNPAELAKAVQQLLDDEGTRLALGHRLHELFRPAAAAAITNQIESLISSHE